MSLQNLRNCGSSSVSLKSRDTSLAVTPPAEIIFIIIVLIVERFNTIFCAIADEHGFRDSCRTMLPKANRDMKIKKSFKFIPVDERREGLNQEELHSNQERR